MVETDRAAAVLVIVSTAAVLETNFAAAVLDVVGTLSFFSIIEGTTSNVFTLKNALSKIQ